MQFQGQYMTVSGYIIYILVFYRHVLFPEFEYIIQNTYIYLECISLFLHFLLVSWNIAVHFDDFSSMIKLNI
jgi:hypothetical protein